MHNSESSGASWSRAARMEIPSTDTHSSPADTGSRYHGIMLRCFPGDRELPMTRPLDRLLAIMARLRDPERGCPWDRVQDFSTIAPYTIEEAYEVADAIARGDEAALKDELG